MDLVVLKVIILIIFCLIGLGVGGLVGGLVGDYKKTNIPSIKVENVKKFPSVKEECPEGICLEPKNWKGEK